MLTRSKIKMEDSIRHTHQELPYFSNDYNVHPQRYSKATSPNPNNQYSQQQINILNDYQGSAGEQVRIQANSRNEILKQLRQEYEILKNLSVQDTLNLYGKNYEQQDMPRLSGSSVSSSVRSKKSNPLRESDARSPKAMPKEIETLHLEKKQLQIVIGNSMRKIEELLNNEILLKKTIHELKNQLEGKGGVHQEYDKTIKVLQKTNDELQEEINASHHQNQKNAQRVKDLSDKLRQMEGQLAGKDRQLKQAFDEQRRLHEQVRLEKDRYLNLEIQCKTYKMEFDLLEKEKNSEVNRLLRQFESKEGSGEKEMAFLIRKLEEEAKEKDRRYHELLVEKEQLRREKETEPVNREKNYIQEWMYKSREMNDTSNKQLTDSVNLIFAKMAELEKKNDETLRREMQALRKKSQDNKRTSAEIDLIAKVTDLERTVDRDLAQKSRLQQEISRLKDQLYELQDKNKDLIKKCKALQEREIEHKQEIEELSRIKSQFNITVNDHRTLQEEIVSSSQTIKSLQTEIDGHRQYVNHLNLSFKEKEKKYEDQLRVLKRKVDEAEFQTQKAKKQAEFNLSILRADHEAEAKRVVEENVKVGQRLKEVQETATVSRSTLENQLKAKETEITTLKNTLQSLKIKAQEDLMAQRQFFDGKLVATENRHAMEIKAFNDKFLTVTSANEKLLSQISTLASKDSEIIELRRLLKQSTTMTTGVSHLWEIKEAQYGNINQVLTQLRSV